MPYKTIIGIGLLAIAIGSSSRAQASSAQTHSETYGIVRMQSDETVSYDGPKRREERIGTMQIPMLGAHALTSIDIQRGDLMTLWRIDAKKKRYTETPMKTLEETKKELASATQSQGQPPPAKQKESEIAIKSIDAHVDGPGAAKTINGFSCRPYLIKIKTIYESTKDHSEVMTQNQVQKLWTTDASGALAAYQKDELAFYKALSEKFMGGKDPKQVMNELTGTLPISPVGGSDYWAKYAQAYSKVKGVPVRMVFLLYQDYAGMQVSPQTPTAEPESADDSVVQAGDFSGGVGGLMSGIAGRLAAKKMKQKMADSSKRPEWLTDVDPADTHHGIMTAILHEIKSADDGAVDSAAFEVPTGYKKVKSL